MILCAWEVHDWEARAQLKRTIYQFTKFLWMFTENRNQITTYYC